MLKRILSALLLLPLCLLSLILGLLASRIYMRTIERLTFSFPVKRYQIILAGVLVVLAAWLVYAFVRLIFTKLFALPYQTFSLFGTVIPTLLYTVFYCLKEKLLGFSVNEEFFAMLLGICLLFLNLIGVLFRTRKRARPSGPKRSQQPLR